MSHDKTLFEPSYDPHGYQPIAIDEDCLTDEDRRQAIIEAVDHPCDSMSYLTTKELDGLRRAFKELNKKPSSHSSSNELNEYRCKQIEMGRLGMFRAFARDKYSRGQRIWFGDGVPFM